MLLKILILIIPISLGSALYCFHAPNTRQLSFHQCSQALAAESYEHITRIYGTRPISRSSNLYKCVDLNTTLGKFL